MDRSLTEYEQLSKVMYVLSLLHVDSSPAACERERKNALSYAYEFSFYRLSALIFFCYFNTFVSISTVYHIFGGKTGEKNVHHKIRVSRLMCDVLSLIARFSGIICEAKIVWFNGWESRDNNEKKKATHTFVNDVAREHYVDRESELEFEFIV